MNEWLCTHCGETFKADEPTECPNCLDDSSLMQICPMCGTIIDPDTKVCPECKEAVA